MNELQRQQVRWDQEGQTIEAGSRAFTPQPLADQLAGAALVLGIFVLIAFYAAVLP